MTVHKEKVYKADHSTAAHAKETPLQRANRRNGQTDLQNDEEDRAIAAANANPTVVVDGVPSKAVTVTREKNMPGNRPGEEIAGESSLLNKIPPDSTSGTDTGLKK